MGKMPLMMVSVPTPAEPLQLLPLAGLQDSTGRAAVLSSMNVGLDPASGVATAITMREPSRDGVNRLEPDALDVAAFLYGFNGVSFDRLSTAGSLSMSNIPSFGGLISVQPGEWTTAAQPAVSVVATATRAAGGVGVRHICRWISATSSGPAAQTSVDVVLRDGVSGVGAILWAGSLAFGAGGTSTLILTGVSIFGSPSTAMTLEFQAAPTLNNFQRVTLGGFDVL